MFMRWIIECRVLSMITTFGGRVGRKHLFLPDNFILLSMEEGGHFFAPYQYSVVDLSYNLLFVIHVVDRLCIVF